MPRKASKKTLKAKADKLAGEACRARGYCEAQRWMLSKMSIRFRKCSQRLEWAHIKSRGICSLRHDPKNCVCLCWSCHKYFTENPDEFYRFIDWLDPERWAYLNVAYRLNSKPDYQYWIDFYQEAS